MTLSVIQTHLTAGW